jgi:hypothetical protein
LQKQRDVAEELDVDGRDLADDPIRRQSGDADNEADDGRKDDSEDGNINGVEQANEERAAIGRIRAVGNDRRQDLEAGPIAQEIEPGGDIGAPEVGDRVVDDPPEKGDQENRECDLEDDAADRGVVEDRRPGGALGRTRECLVSARYSSTPSPTFRPPPVK